MGWGGGLALPTGAVRRAGQPVGGFLLSLSPGFISSSNWNSLLPLVFVLAERPERMNEIYLLVAEVSWYLPQSFAQRRASRWVVFKCWAAVAFKGVAV